MSDLISRQAVMKEFSDFVRRANNSDFAQTPTWNDAVSLVGSLPSAEVTLCHLDSPCEYQNADIAMPSAQQWIPCSERLPSDGENVLLCSTLFGNVAIGKLIRYNTSCCWEVDHWDCDIEDWQAWMPLPKPWRGEEDDSDKD